MWGPTLRLWALGRGNKDSNLLSSSQLETDKMILQGSRLIPQGGRQAWRRRKIYCRPDNRLKDQDSIQQQKVRTIIFLPIMHHSLQTKQKSSYRFSLRLTKKMQLSDSAQTLAPKIIKDWRKKSQLLWNQKSPIPKQIQVTEMESCSKIQKVQTMRHNCKVLYQLLWKSKIRTALPWPEFNRKAFPILRKQKINRVN